jgi:hypothetical protein
MESIEGIEGSERFRYRKLLPLPAFRALVISMAIKISPKKAPLLAINAMPRRRKKISIQFKKTCGIKIRSLRRTKVPVTVKPRGMATYGT